MAGANMDNNRSDFIKIGKYRQIVYPVLIPGNNKAFRYPQSTADFIHVFVTAKIIRSPVQGCEIIKRF